MSRFITEFKRAQIIDNFVSTMDLDLDMTVQLLNADTDAGLYNWDAVTHSKVVDAIYESYEEKWRNEA